MSKAQQRAIALLQQGIALHNAGRLDEADAVYCQVLAEHPRQPDALHLRALIFLARQNFVQALRHAESAIAVAPKTANFFNTAGECHRQLKAPKEAAKQFQTAIALAPNNPEPHHKLALCLEALEQWDAAQESNQRALAIRPDNPDALLHGLRLALRRDDEPYAYRIAGQLHQRYPDNPHLWLACGDLYNQQNRFADAEQALKKAAKLGADHEKTCLGIGLFWIEQKRYVEARALYSHWLIKHPESAAAHFGLASVELAHQAFSSGWRHFEYRWQLPEHTSPKFIAAKDWDGEPARHLLLYAEQGLGDSLMFLRFVPKVLRAKVDAVTLLMPPPLERIARSLTDDSRLTIVTALPAAPNFDAACPLMSLPRALKCDTVDALSIKAPYIFADAARTQYFRDKLAPLKTSKVGLVWAGGKAGIANQRRQMAIDALQPLLEETGITIISLQHGQALPFTQYASVDLTPDIVDFHDLAAAMMALDVIVSIDSGPAHLAGALGKPCVTLLPWLHDWRWGIDGDDSYWYPSMRLIRQPTGGSWAPAITTLIEHLRAMAAAQTP